MADNDYNIIKPVATLQNIGGLASIKRQKEKKRKQDSHEQKKQEPQQKPNESIGAEDTGTKLTENEGDSHFIDYRA